jgi:uncharacterized protein YjiS (DUF1127 family)
MAQALKKQVPSLTAAHMAAFTTVAEAPELHLPANDRVGVVDLQWWRHPAIVMRGWGPRVITRRQSLAERLESAAVAAFAKVREWRERARSRHALLKLDDHMLHDLGISRATAEFKGSVPFWRADE